MNRRRIVVLAVVPVGILLVIAVGLGVALTSGSDGSSTSSSRADRTTSGGSGSAPRAALESGADKNAVAAKPVQLRRDVVSRASLSLQSTDVGKTRARLRAMLSRWRATVSDEHAQTDRPGRIDRATLILRVPSASFPQALDALSSLAKVVDVDQSATDVTSRVVDTGARVRAMAAGVRRVQALLAQADDLSQIVSIEAELTRRQADLDSMRSQAAALADQTAMSTITVSIARHAAPAPPPRRAGFIRGLRSGLHALAASARAVSAVVGVVLPFAVLLALLGWPAWLVVRRRRAGGLTG